MTFDPYWVEHVCELISGNVRTIQYLDQGTPKAPCACCLGRLWLGRTKEQRQERRVLKAQEAV
jgi:hypothetical protein